ncbi:MAG: hypothetical protein PHS30_06180 [Bacteroidales bacterium]|nr:hypothetical protein [Bacteroidales bacterium]
MIHTFHKKSQSVKVFLFVLFMVAKLHVGLAQDSIQVTGPWKVQPAVSPTVVPNPESWGISKGTDRLINWKYDLKCGDNTSWASVPHDSINSLWYQKTVFIPESWKSHRILLHFRRIEGDAVVFLNDKKLSELLRPGGDVDLSAHALFGKENTLRVFITRNYTGISRNFQADPLRFQVRQGGVNAIPLSQWPMGITAPVTVISLPPQSITDVFCIPSFRKKALDLQVEILGKTENKPCYIEAEILDQENIKVLTMKGPSINLSEDKSIHTVTAPWVDAVCWELDRPYLYKARVKLMQNGKAIYQFKDVTFGFREIWTEGNKLIMNGHLSRWRLTDLYGTNKNGLSFYRLMGYNVGQIQPHSNLWWGADTETPLLDEDMLDEMDRLGMGCTAPAPSVAKVRGVLISNKKAREDYQKEVEYYIRHYRNHPCIFAWVVGMNSTNPKSNIWPWSMGKRDSVYSGQGKVIDQASSIVKKEDPTRLAFSHADGSVGDVSSANVYLNFVPLQEREDWPMEWAKNGNMPYSAIEFGPPYWNNFWKGNQFLLTEYLSMYLGDEAYSGESEQGLRNTVNNSVAIKGNAWVQLDFRDYPGFWSFQKLFALNTNRSWRTWGVNAGWLNWLLEGYGDPPGEKRRFTSRYKYFPAPLTKTPEWVSPRYHIFKQANQPLLVYMAGYPVHTDKTHSFFSGETVQKQIAAVWDSVGKRTLKAEWVLKRGDQVIQKGMEEISLSEGEIKLQPFKFTAPVVQQRTSMNLLLRVKDSERTVATDTFSLEIFPKLVPVQTKTRFVVYDPLNKSLPWIEKLGIHPVLWEEGFETYSTDVLIIGREALKQGDRLPYTESDIAAGLRVIILEQKPQIWEGMGFQTIEAMSRYTYIRDTESPFLKGLLPQDLVNWRGTPDLLPEGKPARAYDTQRAPKWTNTHAVASVAIKTPNVAGFTPILQTEFDMAYSPLLEWTYGKGKITFCSLDLTGRVGEDPAATSLAVNLLSASTPVDVASRKVYYSGGLQGLRLLNDLGVLTEKEMTGLNPKNSILVIGQGKQSLKVDKINQFAKKGGIVFHLPQTADFLSAEGFQMKLKNITKVSTGENSKLFRGVGPSLLRWRDILNVTAFAEAGQPTGSSVFCDGLILERTIGKGKNIYLQVDPGMLAGRYPDSAEKTEAVQLSVIRLQQLTAQLLTNIGACPEKTMAERLTSVAREQTYQTLGSWKVLGPYIFNTSDGKKAIETVFPAQKDAIEGAENPNITYKREDGVVLDWRRVINSDQNGYIDLRSISGGKDENVVAYVTKNISCLRDQHIVLRFGVDFWMEVWLNGESILKVVKGHHKRENEFIVNAPFRKGENILTIKVASGSAGFGFWANMANPSENSSERVADSSETTVHFYAPLYKYFDPYQFDYW